VSEICEAARAAARKRNIFVVGECEPQDSRLLKGSGAYRDGLDAMWNEDWHHSAYVALTGRRHAYFTDYDGSAPEFASMSRHGFLYQGQWYSWQKQGRGGYSLGLPSSRFVWFLENHDQVANTGLGERLYHLVDKGRWRACTALLLLGPALPLLFQGQEFGSSRPFTYFADHEGELATSVRNGRVEFLRQFPPLATSEMGAAIPDPSDLDTFNRCKLDDGERSDDGPCIRLYQDLLRLRREDSVLREVGTPSVQIEASAPTSSVLCIRYIHGDEHRLLVVNFADEHRCRMNDPLLAAPPSRVWIQEWSSEQQRYGGGGALSIPDTNPWTLPAASAAFLVAGPAKI
jgi:maltooligosyltrehalose trehalohydrolase